MAEEIINRVAQSKLRTFDLETLYPTGERVVLDIKDWLFEGLLLREKEFRAHAEAHDWSRYQDAFVALTCSTDAIVPGWAYLLLTTKITPYAKKVVQGDLVLLETVLYKEVLQTVDYTEYQDAPVILKGCSHKPVPPNAYLFAMEKLQKVAKSVMYGEACSAVPLYKRK